MTVTNTATLPQLRGELFITEGGLETDLIFNHGLDLPDFASFPLVETEQGRATLTAYFQDYVDLARRHGRGVVFETPTWRASADWATRLGFSAERLDRVNRQSVRLLRALGSHNPDVPMVVSGNIGPRGDGYVVDDAMTVNQAAAYHGLQIASFAEADMVAFLTATYSAEAAGVAIAAREAGMPCAISFTVETDGRLPSGQPLADAIIEVDQQTGDAPAYYMVNCAHPTHFDHLFDSPGPWNRIRGIRSNASALSHEELDNAEELDRGDEAELASGLAKLAEQLPRLAVVGGCCGTDLAHIERISTALSQTGTTATRRR